MTPTSKIVCKVAESCENAALTSTEFSTGKWCAHYCWFGATMKSLNAQRDAHAERRGPCKIIEGRTGPPCDRGTAGCIEGHR